MRGLGGLRLVAEDDLCQREPSSVCKATTAAEGEGGGPFRAAVPTHQHRRSRCEARLSAQRGSWRSTAGMHLLRKLAGHHEPGRLPAIAHGAVLRSRAESSRGARDGVAAGAVAAGGGHLLGAVCFRGGLFVVWGFGLEKAFFPFKPLTPQTPSGKRTHKSPTAGRFPIPAPRPSSSENALR